MPKKPKPSKPSGKSRRKVKPQQDPEPKGGPFARRQAFLEERLTKLEPKRPEREKEDRSGERRRASQKRKAEEGISQPPASGVAAQRLPAVRRRMVEEYRQRQAAQLRVPEGRRPRKELRAAPPVVSTPETEAEDDLFGPQAENRATPAAELAPPPQPPAPPPANNWVPIGPSVMRRGQGGTLPSTSGRAIGIAVASGGDRVYAAAANGGVWRSDDAGDTWRSLMDAWDINPSTLSSDSLACGSIAIDPTNPDRVCVGTGDGDEALFFGVGPVFSPDGGANWMTEPVASGSPSLDGSAMNALAVDPANPDRVVAGSLLGLYRREPNPSGGFHWARKTGPSGWITSVVVARTGGTTTFYAAPSSGPVYSSTDGHTWAPVGTGFPSTNVARVGLGVRANDPSVIYALIAATDNSLRGVWRLDTSSGQWRQVSGAPTDLFGTAAIGFQGTYDLAIAVDPNNANLIYLGGSTKASAGEWSGSVYRCAVTSSGSGASLTYSMTNTYIGGSVHADIHCMTFAPGDSSKLWLGCDGGVFYSTNPTGSG